MHTDRLLAGREPKLGRFEAIEAGQIEQEGLTRLFLNTFWIIYTRTTIFTALCRKFVLHKK